MDQNAIDVVSRALRTKARHLHGAIEKNYARFGEQWFDDFNRVLKVALASDDDFQSAVEGYAAFSNAAMRSQARFQKTGSYENSSFAEVSRNVYQNNQHMSKEYLPGLLLSHFLWPHHYAQLRFFCEMLQGVQPKRFVEIGTGSGVYSLTTLQMLPSAIGFGIDISSASLEFTGALIRSAGLDNRYHLVRGNVMNDDLGFLTDLVISVELLEHLENPLSFLQRLTDLVGRNGYGFITAALNASHTDHIYLYSSIREVLKHVEDAGFSISRMFFEEAYSRRTSDELVPAVVAFMVHRMKSAKETKSSGDN